MILKKSDIIIFMENKFTYEELFSFYQISKEVFQTDNLNFTLKNVLKILEDSTGFNRGIISLYFKDKNEIHHDSFGVNEPDEEIIYSLGEGITGEVVKSGNPIAIPRLDQSSIFLDKTGMRKNIDKKEIAFICVPIIYQNETVGTISVDCHTKEDNDFSHEILFLEKIAEIISELVKRKIIYSENTKLKQMIKKTNPLGTIIGNSKPMRELAYQVSLISDSGVSVLITGETGTGKELVAKEIHSLSSRRDMPFITINCGAIPEGLIESELFGHAKGSFTGAVKDRVGKFLAANGGTLFLDEMGDLPPLMQVKLLRALQEKEITPIGSNESKKIDVRVIAATNKNLEEEIANGNFRSDLYYRLNVFHLYLPPLRDRGADIVLLTDYFIKKYSEKSSVQVVRIDTASIDMLTAYHWPGNVRELENCIERACLLADDGVIHSHHLPPSIQMKSVEKRGKKRGKFEALVRAYEMELITDTLKDTGGNQTNAAKLLGTTKRVIQYKISQYGIDYKRFSRIK